MALRRHCKRFLPCGGRGHRRSHCKRTEGQAAGHVLLRGIRRIRLRGRRTGGCLHRRGVRRGDWRPAGRKNQGRHHRQPHHHHHQRLCLCPADGTRHSGDDERPGRDYQFRHPADPFAHGNFGLGNRWSGADRTYQLGGAVHYAGLKRTGRRRGGGRLLLPDGGLCGGQLS